ncbi:Tetratricopeptide repeat-containing protein [Candidatus Electronema halotolerans]
MKVMGHTCFFSLKGLFHKRRAAQLEAECRRLQEAAGQAEAADDHLRAAGLLEQVHTLRPENALLLRLARCWLRAGQWQQAADAYSETGCSGAADWYDAGFALAKLDRFAVCLRCWRQTGSSHPAFLAQQKQVSLLLLQELSRCLDEQSWAQEEQVRALLTEFSLTELPGGHELLARCDRVRLARLWQEDRLEEIMAMAAENDLNHPAVLEIQAKAACQLLAGRQSAVSAAELRQFMDCWLSALFHPAIAPQAEAERQALLEFGADLLRRHAARLNHDEQLMREWEELLALLHRLALLPAVREQNLPLCTPALALRTDQQEQFCTLIRTNQEHFADRRAWIAAGAAYASASALLLVRDNACQDALKELGRLEEQGDDLFLAHGAAQVRTACGIEALRHRRCREAEEILVGGEPQAGWSAELEKELLAVLAQENGHEAPCLAASLGILSLLPKTSPPDAAACAFCSALTKLVLRLHNGKQARPQLLAAAMQQAVALNPEDEFARMMLEEVSIALELAELHEAVDQGWLSKAARIAAASRYQQVAEHFFTAAQQVAVQLEQGHYPDDEAAMLILEDLLRSVSRVDPGHQMISSLRRALDDLRLRQEGA